MTGKKPRKGQGKVEAQGKSRSPRSKGLKTRYSRALKQTAYELRPTMVCEELSNYQGHVSRLTAL